MKGIGYLKCIVCLIKNEKMWFCFFFLVKGTTLHQSHLYKKTQVPGVKHVQTNAANLNVFTGVNPHPNVKHAVV